MPRLSRWPSRRSGPDTAPAAAEVLALAAEAEAEAAEAEAQAAAAAAEAARLRAEALRVEEAAELEAAQVAAELEATDIDAVDAAVIDGDAVEGDAVEGDELPRDDEPRNWRRLWPLAAAGVTAALVGALAGTAGFLAWHHQAQSRVAESKADFIAAADRGVVNLLSMDFTKGDEDLQRLIDSSTGEFRDDFEKSRNDFLNVLRSSKATTKATIRASAVEELYRDAAVVLVGASSEVSNTAAAEQQPRAWRLRVTVSRDGGDIKMSKVEFVL